VPVVAGPYQTINKQKQKSRELAQTVHVAARPCATPRPPKPKFSFFFLLFQTTQLLSSFNLQTSITHSKLHQITQFLHQIISKLHSKHNLPIKNNNHPPQPQNHKIRVPPNPNTKTPKSSSILTPTLKFLTKNPNSSLKPHFPHKILPNLNLHPKPTQVKLGQGKQMASKRTGKEAGSSSGGPPYKKSTVRKHDIEFKDAEQRNKGGRKFAIFWC